MQRENRVDGERQVSRGITVFISECLREKALNQTGTVTLTVTVGVMQEGERGWVGGVSFKLTYRKFTEHQAHQHIHTLLTINTFPD